jgi:hypothetical protein
LQRGVGSGKSEDADFEDEGIKGKRKDGQVTRRIVAQ